MRRVLIADDHKIVREVLSCCLHKAGLEVVAEATGADEAVARADECHPEITILDVAMPGDVLEAIRALKSMVPAPKVLVLTASDDEELAVRCMKAGADGFLRKTRPVHELMEAVERLRRGGKYLSAELACRLVTSGPQDDQPHRKLSDRETQVLCLLGQAGSVTGIAEELGVSFKTVSTYRTRILEKMDFDNNTDIIRYCLKHELGRGTG